MKPKEQTDFIGHVEFFCGNAGKKLPFSSPKSFFAVVFRARAELGKHAALFDEYFSALLMAIDRAHSTYAIGKGYEAAATLIDFCTDIEGPLPCNDPPDGYIKEPPTGSPIPVPGANEHIAFLELSAAHFKKEFAHYKDDFTFEFYFGSDVTKLDEMYRELDKLMMKDGMMQGMMELILSGVRELFFVVPTLQIFRQGYMEKYLDVMIEESRADGRPIWQVWADRWF